MEGFGINVSITIVIAIIAMTSALDCKSGTAAKYNMIFNPLWSNSQFPKQYPAFATWSSLVGKFYLLYQMQKYIANF